MTQCTRLPSGGEMKHFTWRRLWLLVLSCPACETTDDLHETRSQTDEVITVCVPPAFIRSMFNVVLAGNVEINMLKPHEYIKDSVMLLPAIHYQVFQHMMFVST